MDDDLWQKRIGRCIEATRAWESRTTSEDGTPDVGSRIALEDETNRSLTFSTAAWSSISMAVDHLGLADDAMSREGGGRLRPFAFYTLCRGALVASSQAVWILSSGRESRLRRLRFLELAELDGQRGYLRDFVNDKHLEGEVSAGLITGLKNQLLDVERRHKALRSALSPFESRDHSVTRILTDAANVVNESGGNDSWLNRAYLSEWRLASGAAHARIWPGDVRPHESVPLVGQRSHLRVSTGTLESYGTSLAAATMATSEAFRLWDKHAHSSK